MSSLIRIQSDAIIVHGPTSHTLTRSNVRARPKINLDDCLEPEPPPASTTEPQLSVTVGRPYDTDFVRVRPVEPVRVPLLRIPNERLHLLTQPVARYLADDPCVATYALYVFVTRQSRLGIWPVKAPVADRTMHSYTRTAHEAVEQAQQEWVRVCSDQINFTYCTRPSANHLGEPMWNDLPTDNDLISSAFADTFIDSVDHPLVRRLEGRV